MIIGFIGAGKMARALASGLVRGGLVRSEELTCSSRSRESGRAFLDLFPDPQPLWLENNRELVRRCDLVILALKPHQLAEALPPLREVSAGKLFLSLAVGVTLKQLGAWLSPSARVVRAMPNTPLQVGAGATVYAVDTGVTEIDLSLIERLLSSVGRVWRVEENQINTITALSGSGPAYVLHFIDALIRAATVLGLSETLARDLAVQTVLGTALTAAHSPLSPLDLAAQVKSPRGTTVAGCAVLEDHDALNQLMSRCLAAARDRAEALSRGEL